jgi:hypothetical protein
MKDAEKKKKEEQDGGEGGESQKSDRTDAVIASSTSQAALGIAQSSAHLISSQPITSHHISSLLIYLYLLSRTPKGQGWLPDPPPARCCRGQVTMELSMAELQTGNKN